jgi:xylan 1,4-beta-xylosidase
MYSSYTAASFGRIYDLARHFDVNLIGIVSWSFQFEDQPWFHGFRDLATNGVGKPVLNVFRMFGKMGETRIEANVEGGFGWRHIIDSGVRGDLPDIGVLATRNADGGAAIMFWNYHDDDKAAPDAETEVVIKGVKGKKVTMTQYRIDKDFSNSYEVWKRMGSPQNPSPAQYAELEKAGKLQVSARPVRMKVRNGTVVIDTKLQRQGVGLITLD